MPASHSSRLFQELLQRVSEEHDRQVAELHAENDRLRGFSQPLEAYPKQPNRQKNGVSDSQGHQALPSEASSQCTYDNTAMSPSMSPRPQPGVFTEPVVNDHYLWEGNGTYTSLRHVTLASPRGEPDIAALNAAYAVATIVEEDQEDCEFLETDIVDPNGIDRPLQLPREFDSTPLMNMRQAGGPADRLFSPALPPPPQAPLGQRAEARKVVEDHTVSQSLSMKPVPTVYSEADLSPRLFKSSLEKWQALITFAQEQMSPYRESVCILDPAWEEIDNLAIDIKFTGKKYTGELDMMLSKSSMSHAKSRKSKLPSMLIDPSSSTAELWNRCVEACQKPWCQVMHPNSRKRVIWDMICMSLLAHDVIVLPLQVFDNGTAGLPQGYDDFMRTFDLVSACFWTCDMIVSFFTGYFSLEGFLELRFRKVMWHYLRSWFLLDLIIVTTDWITLGIGLGSTSGYLRLGKTVSRVMRVLRLLRFMKLNKSMKAIFERINSEYVLTLAGLVRLVIYIVITSHYIACAWYALSQAGDRERNWANKFLNHTDSMAYAYSTALHWSLTQFTPASMEVVPQNVYERFFNACVIIIAMVTFSSFVSSITSAMTHIRNINARKMEQDAQIRQYFNENKVTHQLASRIWHFLRKNRLQSVKFLREEDIPVLKALPERIRDELRLEVYMPLLVNHPVFAIYFNLDPKPMRLLVKRALVHRTLMSNEELFSDEATGNGVVNHMFFVVSGSVFYNVQDQGMNLQVTRGHWACEVALWGARAMLDGPFVASTGGCDLIMICNTDFQEITKQHLDSVGFLVKYAQLFIQSFNQAVQDPADENILFDKVEVLHWLAVQAYQSVGLAIRHQGSTMGRDNIIRALFDVPFSRPSSMRRSSILSDAMSDDEATNRGSVPLEVVHVSSARDRR